MVLNAQMKKYGMIGGVFSLSTLIGYKMYRQNQWENAPI